MTDSEYTPSVEDIQRSAEREYTREEVTRAFAEVARAAAEKAWDEAEPVFEEFFTTGPHGHFENDMPRPGFRRWVADPRPANPYRLEQTDGQ